MDANVWENACPKESRVSTLALGAWKIAADEKSRRIAGVRAIRVQQDEWAYKLMAKTDFVFHYAGINYISSSTSPFAIPARKDRHGESNISFRNTYPSLVCQ